MKKKLKLSRIVFLAITLLAVLFIFTYEMIQIQIVNNEEHKANANKTKTRNLVEEALRGELIDANGDPIVINEIGHNIVIDRVFVKRDSLNEIILTLTKLLEENDIIWIDTLPITKDVPFEFINEDERGSTKKRINRLKEDANLQFYATSENVMTKLFKEYSIDVKEYSQEEARIIAGIRYEMILKDFGNETIYTFAENIPFEMVVKINESLDFPGVSTTEVPTRQYVSGDVGSHFIGQVSPIYIEEFDELEKKGYELNDKIGRGGVEGALESTLRGVNGTVKHYLDSDGKIINPNEAETLTKTIPGNTLKLTIDMELQKVTQDALQRRIHFLRTSPTSLPGQGKEADVGAAVVIEIETGKILSLASYPSFNIENYLKDYNSLVKNPQNPLFNRALFGKYAPGSTYKPVTALAALVDGNVTPTSVFYCGRVFNYLDYNPTCLSHHGNVNVVTALQKSCNIFFYNAGLSDEDKGGTGIESLDYYAKMLGLGEKTGIEISESIGQRANPENKEKQGEIWNPGDVIQTSIGQSINQFSPLQIANYTATLARDGVLLEPHIIDQVLNYNRTKVIKDYEIIEISKIVSDEKTKLAFDTIREGMIKASQPGGTSVGVFDNYPHLVASKTGTPQTNEYPNSVYIAYAPADNPKIAVAIFIEKGWHGYTGAPVAKEIFDYYFFKTKINEILEEIDYTENEIDENTINNN